MAYSSSLTRRRLLASAAAMAGIAASRPAIALTRAKPPGGLTFHLVDGWILTNHDLEALGLDAE